MMTRNANHTDTASGATHQAVLASPDSDRFKAREALEKRNGSDEMIKRFNSSQNSLSSCNHASGGSLAGADPHRRDDGPDVRRNSQDAYTSASESESEGGAWGWYEDRDMNDQHHFDSVRSWDASTPDYILEDTLATQMLWHSTAGKRPRQPADERRRCERLWEQNFRNSSAVDLISGGGREPYSGDDDIEPGGRGSEPGSSGDGDGGSGESPIICGRKSSQVLYRTNSPFGTSVTKSFLCGVCAESTTVTVQIPKLQIVATPSDVHAEYLVVAGIGSVTLGVWRRSSHFSQLAEAIRTGGLPADAPAAAREEAVATAAHLYQNSLASWTLLRRRQRWFRCLDKEYLVLKCFLLERFLHDLVFESRDVRHLIVFLGIDDVLQLPHAHGGAYGPGGALGRAVTDGDGGTPTSRRRRSSRQSRDTDDSTESDDGEAPQRRATPGSVSPTTGRMSPMGMMLSSTTSSSASTSTSNFKRTDSCRQGSLSVGSDAENPEWRSGQ